jgi:hypothetical protein
MPAIIDRQRDGRHVATMEQRPARRSSGTFVGYAEVWDEDPNNPTGAVSLYERVGMRVAASYDPWPRSIEGSRP